jgi:hypothetical protein
MKTALCHRIIVSSTIIAALIALPIFSTSTHLINRKWLNHAHIN